MKLTELLSLLLCLHGVIELCTCCSSGYFLSSNKVTCCRLCPAGFFLVQECTASTERKCQACPANTYTSLPNNLGSCEQCKRSCAGQKVIVAKCNSTADIVCECPSQKYWDTHLLRCTKCSECKPGEKLVSPCQKYSNAQCQRCQKDTYLNSATKECSVCSYCSKGQMVAEECTSWKNTVCHEVPSCSLTVQHPTQQYTTTHRPPKNTSTPQFKRDIDGPGTLPDCGITQSGISVLSQGLLCVIVVLFIIIVLGLAIFIKQRIWTASKDTHWQIGAPKNTVSTLGSSTVIKENNIKFNTTSADVTEKLGFYLNSKHGKNWKVLAGKMGYTSNDTQNWELTPTEATQKLLHDWQQRSNATVYVLYLFLKELERDDAASVLLPLLLPSREGENV